MQMFLEKSTIFTNSGFRCITKLVLTEIPFEDTKKADS